MAILTNIYIILYKFILLANEQSWSCFSYVTTLAIIAPPPEIRHPPISNNPINISNNRNKPNISDKPDRSTDKENKIRNKNNSKKVLLFCNFLHCLQTISLYFLASQNYIWHT